VIATGAAGYLLTQGGSDEGTARYDALLHPTSEPSFQARLTRWDEALTVIPEHPFGLGLGTVGGAQAHFATTRNIETNPNLDSTYLKVALEQGLAVFGVFCAALVLLMYGLASRAVATYERAKAALAIGACGTLAAMSVLFFIGFYGIGRPALAGWIMVGIGVSQFAFLDRGDVAMAEESAPEDLNGAPTDNDAPRLRAISR
jgi:O-antigen ligase